MNNETRRILKNYLFRNGDGFSFNVNLFGIEMKEACSLLSNWHNFERPDIYSVHNDKIYGLEHFEFDAYSRSKRGSLQHRKNVKIRQSIEAEIREKFKNKDSVTSFRKLNSKASEKDYKANFTKSFKMHCAKIDEYKDCLSKALSVESQRTSIWFIAEDMTMLGSYLNNAGNPKQNAKPAFPIYFPEIENLFLESKKLEGIIFADNCNKILTLVKRNKKAVEMLKSYYCYSGESPFFFEPKIACAAVKILNQES